MFYADIHSLRRYIMKLTLSNFSACKCRAAKTNNNANSLSSFKNSSQATSINYAPIYYKSTINNAFSFKGLDEARERELSELVSSIKTSDAYVKDYQADIRENVLNLSRKKDDLEIARMLSCGLSTEKQDRTFNSFLIARSGVLTMDNFDFAKELMTAKKENGEWKYHDGDIECILYSATKETTPWMKDNMDFVDSLLSFRDESRNVILLRDFPIIINACAKGDNADFIQKLVNLKKEDGTPYVDHMLLPTLVEHLDYPDVKEFLNIIVDKVDEDGNPLIAHLNVYPMLSMLAHGEGRGWEALQFFKKHI